MLFSSELQEGVLVCRYKRFFADVLTGGGETITIHCPNTGSMRNCLNEGGKVWFSRSSKPERKLPWTWELAETPQGRLACVNTMRATALVEEALQAGIVSELAGFSAIQREVSPVPGSRLDLCLEFPQGKTYVEIKSVTLGFDDSPVAAFPDAVSTRGAKHLYELARLSRQGIRAVQFFCVNLSGVTSVRVADEIDSAYTSAFREALEAGVEILAYGTEISPQEIRITHRLPMIMP